MTSPDPISALPPPLAGRASASQRWIDVSFIHWAVPAALVAPLLPDGLVPDEYDGSSWVGLVPFELDRATVFGSPPVPYFGHFVEINVRLYAYDGRGRRGVVFISMEASRLAAVLGARTLFSLPYFWSRTSLVRSGKQFRYLGTRHLGGNGHTEVRVLPTTRQVTADPRADFLTARWGLFTRFRGRTVYLRVFHEPWTLYDATLEGIDDNLVTRAGFDVSGRMPDSVLYSPGVTARFGKAE